MIRPLGFLIILSLAAVYSLSQSNPIEVRQTVESQLMRKVVVIRGYPRSEQLHFAADGKLLSAPDPGVGASDGQIVIDGVQIHSSDIVVRGSLPTMYFDLKSGRVAYQEGYIRRSVTVDATDTTSVDRVMESIWRAFYRPGEAAAQGCSAEESSYFLSEVKLQSAKLGKPSNNKDSTKPPDDKKPLCLPNGERIDRVGGPIKVPRAYSTPDPSYTQEAKAKRVRGQVMLGAVIDAQGRPSTLIVLQTLDPGLDQNALKAVRNWKFKPATKDGQPLTVFIFIEINFQLY